MKMVREGVLGLGVLPVRTQPVCRAQGEARGSGSKEQQIARGELGLR